jgi:SulP family sulfate permease
MLTGLVGHLTQVHVWTLGIGAAALAFLFWVRSGLKPLLKRIGLSDALAGALTKTGPVVAVVATTLLVWSLQLDQQGVAIVGEVPQRLPPFTMPDLSWSLIEALLLPAALISIIGFVESVSVAQTLAAKKRQRIDPDQELVGLGAANLGAAFTGGYPVTGGFARSVVNFDAGARTPAAGAFTAVGLAVAAVALTPLIYFLPTATLAATIIVAVLSLVDFKILKHTWRYSKSDFLAVALTIGLTLTLGVEIGVATGVLASVILHLSKTARPHVAEVGRVPNSEHFRNIHRHQVETRPEILTLRVDESLYFVNARFLEDLILQRLATDKAIRHVVLMFSAVNNVDYSALESLEELNRRLADAGLKLHLSEVKGPVMDRLETTHFIEHLSGQVFLSQFDAWKALTA